jgi:dihydrofolate reductase
MRPLILKMDISLDGFVAAVDGDNAWVFADSDPTGMRWVLETVRQAGAHVMGRGAYEEMSPYWPTADGPFAAPMNDIPKVVFSKTLVEATWDGTTIASGPLEEEIAKLKAQDGGPLVTYGGARFAQSLAAANLIDQYRLIQHQVVLGDGLRAFRAPLAVRLTDVERFDSGALALTYVPV